MEVILEDINFLWSNKDMKKVTELWKLGENLIKISKAVNREGDEVFLLLMHLARKRKIRIREGYVWGKYDR